MIPVRIAAALGSTNTQQAATALEVLLPDLMKRDIAAAADLAAGLEPWEQREQVLLRVAGTWVKSDPAAAAEWCRDLPDPEERLNCLGAICNKLATTDPAGAMSLVESAGGKGVEALQISLVAPWMAREPVKASAWISAHSDSDFRDRCWSSGLAGLAREAPEQAATLAANNIESGSIQEEAVISVLHQWILNDREAAANWVALFPAGALRERAEGELNPSH